MWKGFLSNSCSLARNYLLHVRWRNWFMVFLYSGGWYRDFLENFTEICSGEIEDTRLAQEGCFCEWKVEQAGGHHRIHRAASIEMHRHAQVTTSCRQRVNWSLEEHRRKTIWSVEWRRHPAPLLTVTVVIHSRSCSKYEEGPVVIFWAIRFGSVSNKSQIILDEASA